MSEKVLTFPCPANQNTGMKHVLWLVYEKPPHPDAVSYPAIETDVRLVLECLNSPRKNRDQLAAQLHRFLNEQNEKPLRQRRLIPCRRPSGLYRFISWRLAKWMRHVLPQDDTTINRVIYPLTIWLDSGRKATRGFHVRKKTRATTFPVYEGNDK